MRKKYSANETDAMPTPVAVDSKHQHQQERTETAPTQDRPDALIARLADPNQPSIQDEIRYIVSLQLSNRPAEWTVADEKQWNTMIKNALAYNRLRRAILFRNEMLGSGKEMTFPQFERLANTGSCRALGISEKDIFKSVLRDVRPAACDDEANRNFSFKARHDAAA